MMRVYHYFYGILIVLGLILASCGGGGNQGAGTDQSPAESPPTGGTPSVPLSASFPVKIEFAEKDGIARSGDIVTFGIPIAQAANLTSTANLGLTDADGHLLPAQFTVTNRWGAAPETSTAPIRWLLVDTPVQVSANQTVTYTLQDFGKPSSATASLAIKEDAQEYTIDTGKAVFAVSKIHPTLLDSVTVDGKTLVSSTKEQGIRLIDRNGNTFFSGKDSQILSTQLERSGLLTAVIRIDGTFPQDFANEFYVERYIQKYATYSQSACDADSACARSIKEYTDKQIAIYDWLYPNSEIYGPREIDYSVWLQFYSGQSVVHTRVTLANHNTCLVYNTGAVACSEDGSLGSVGIDDFSLVFTTALSDSAHYTLIGDDAQVVSGALQAKVLQYQDSSGNANWDNFKNPQAYGLSAVSNSSLNCAVYDDPFGQCQSNFFPRLAASVSFQGYAVEEDTGSGYRGIGAGKHAGGVMILTDDTGNTVGSAVKDFWQNFPKALEADRMKKETARMRIGLFPQEYESLHTLRAGEKKTHEVTLYFGATPQDAADAPRILSSSLAPVWPHADARYYAGTQTLDHMTAFTDLKEGNYKQWNDSLIDVAITQSLNSSTSGWPSESILSMRDEYNRYGYKEFGDDPPGAASYEPILSTDFHKYEFNLGKLKRAFATIGYTTSLADSPHYAATWWTIAAQANLQISNFGFLDTPHSNDELRRYGYIGHEEHEQPGISDWMRANMIGQPTIDTFFSVEGLLDGYYTTGFSQFRQDALKIAETTRYVVTQNAANWTYVPDYDTGDFNRQVGNAFRILVAAYRDTHDQGYMDALDLMVQLSQVPSHFGWWLSCPCAGQSGTIKIWALSMTMIGIGQYMELLTENNLQTKPEYAIAQKVLTTNAQFIADKVIFQDSGYTDNNGKNYRAWPSPQWAVPYYWYVSGDTSETKNYSGSYSPFYLMTVDALAYAAKYATSTDQRSALMSAADKLYHGSAGYSFTPTWPIGLFSHLGEMRHWAVYGDVYNFYKTYGF